MSAQSTQSKAWIAALVGGAVLIGGALVFHLLQQKEDGPSLLDDIDQLGDVKKGPNGYLQYDYYKRVFILIQKHSKLRQQDERKEAVAKRRQFLKDGNEEEYKRIVKELIEREEQCFMDHMMKVIDHIGMDEQTFMMMHQTYMSNPETQQDLMQAQMAPVTPEGSAPKLTKQQTKELFFYSEEKKMDSMKKLMAGGMKRAMRPQDPME